MNWLFTSLLLLLLLAALALTQFRIGSDPRRVGAVEDLAPLRERGDLNVLFLLIDTLRADRLGSYGYERPTSAHLDELAATGIRFDQHLAQSSWTKASMASLWTGFHPQRTRILRFSHGLPDEAVMPAEILRDAGFRTAALWRNGWVSPNFGFSQGFDLYVKPVPGRVPRGQRRENPEAKISGSDQDITAAALEFLRTHTRDRWFLYLHFMDVHQYLSDEQSALFGTAYSDIYDNSIHWTDRQIGRLLRALDEHGLRERTLVVVAADHGEAFGEHGKEGHAKDLYGEVTETPFILGLPFRLEPGLVVREPSQNVDVWPTVLDLLGFQGPAGHDGRSLLTAIERAARRQTPDVSPPRFSHLDRHWGQSKRRDSPIVAVTRVGHRYVEHLGRTDLPPELYDLTEDPGETRNLYAADPERAAEMQRQIAEYLALEPAPWGAGPRHVEIDDMQRGQLRALGYAIE